MHSDIVWETLHPFHLWAQIAAVCAFLLAVASFAVLALSRRFSSRWWLGQGIFTACLLAVVFGARSRGASYDLRPIAVSCFRPPSSSGCEVWQSWVVDAQQRVGILGTLLLIGTLLTLAATIVILLRWRRSADRRDPLPAQRWWLPVGITVAGYGTFQIANSVARWIETAYLADIRNAGDGLGQLPLFFAIAGTIFGVIVLAIGLALVVACTPPRRRHPQTDSPSPIL